MFEGKKLICIVPKINQGLIFNNSIYHQKKLLVKKNHQKKLIIRKIEAQNIS